MSRARPVQSCRGLWDFVKKVKKVTAILYRSEVFSFIGSNFNRPNLVGHVELFKYSLYTKITVNCSGWIYTKTFLLRCATAVLHKFCLHIYAELLAVNIGTRISVQII